MLARLARMELCMLQEDRCVELEGLKDKKIRVCITFKSRISWINRSVIIRIKLSEKINYSYDSTDFCLSSCCGQCIALRTGDTAEAESLLLVVSEALTEEGAFEGRHKREWGIKQERQVGQEYPK